MTRPFHALARAELEGGRVVALPLSPDGAGRPREGLVLLDGAGVVRAYLNRCRHLPIPIDGGSGSYLDAEGLHLLCGTHGALYRREDGFCVEGPCRGLSLEPLEVEELEDGSVRVHEPR